MRNFSFRVSLNASPLQRAIGKMLVISALAVGFPLFAQIKVISADNLTPFEPRDVGTMSDAKTVRIKLNYARAISSIAVAPGSTEFTAGAVSGCVVDGHTVNPGLTACSVDVTFSPQYPGVRTAPLVVTDGAGIKSSVGLAGTGLGPRAALTPGIITTVVGNGTPGFSGDGGPATEAMLSGPRDAKFDGVGDLYISDLNNVRVRKVDRNGIITTVAGNGNYGVSGIEGIGGPATSASLGELFGLAVDPAGNLYFVIDYPQYYVLKVDLNGILTVFAGSGNYGFSGDGGPATKAGLSYMAGLAADAEGNVYIADQQNLRIRKVDTHGIISTVAGGGSGGRDSVGDGGPATQASLSEAWGVAVDAAGNLYIADTGFARIRKVDTNGIITTIAGNGNSGFSGDDGPATQAELFGPTGVTIDAAGNVYIADADNRRVRRVDTNGTIKTIAGTGDFHDSGDGGPATKAGMNPNVIAIDSSGSFLLPNGTGVRKVEVSQSAVKFASQNVGTTSPNRDVVVTNTGNQHIEFTGLSLTGDFGQLTGTARDCTDTTFLGAGFSCALRITFAPIAVGTLTGSATVTDNSLSLPGTTQTISLSGTGVNP
jgi:sugar lactone lactonase YvrE